MEWRGGANEYILGSCEPENTESMVAVMGQDDQWWPPRHERGLSGVTRHAAGPASAADGLWADVAGPMRAGISWLGAPKVLDWSKCTLAPSQDPAGADPYERPPSIRRAPGPLTSASSALQNNARGKCDFRTQTYTHVAKLKRRAIASTTHSLLSPLGPDR